MNEERKIEIEEVSEAPKPPKARVAPPGATEGDRAEAGGGGSPLSQAFERKKDYLAGFLAHKPEEAAPVEPGGNLYEAVIEALKEIYDPEIPVNIYDLGLIYDVEITPEHHAMVKMTLTTPHCPVAESMPGEVELRVGSVPGIGHAEVELVWDPPWDPQKMTDEAKLELGML
ncbi:MAG TPA: SUF system Fe-S cluster assembly protein [Allosphingosinicella sp.]|jgi:FeS assembly SUF system protein